MSRITRAKAAKVAEKLHIDGNAVLSMDSDERKALSLTPEPKERAPLAEVAPNSAGSNPDTATEEEDRDKTSQGKRKGEMNTRSRGKKNGNTTGQGESNGNAAEELLEDRPKETESMQSPTPPVSSVKRVPECKSHLSSCRTVRLLGSIPPDTNLTLMQTRHIALLSPKQHPMHRFWTRCAWRVASLESDHRILAPKSRNHFLSRLFQLQCRVLSRKPNLPHPPAPIPLEGCRLLPKKLPSWTPKPHRILQCTTNWSRP